VGERVRLGGVYIAAAVVELVAVGTKVTGKNSPVVCHIML
jgi:hypothetical protein